MGNPRGGELTIERKASPYKEASVITVGGLIYWQLRMGSTLSRNVQLGQRDRQLRGFRHQYPDTMLILSGLLEVIANAGFRHDISGVRRVWLYLLTQVPDIDTYMVYIVNIFPAPHLFQ